MSPTKSMVSYTVKLPKFLENKQFQLGIAEKPTAARRIAATLNPKSKKVTISVTKKLHGTSSKLPPTEAYYLEYGQENIIIIPAFGHLFTLVQDGGGWQYPVYDFKWVPTYTAVRNANQITSFHKRIESTIESIRHIATLVKKYIIMTDYDEEGEVIGGIILSQLVGEDVLHRAKRMKYSSFAKKELTQSIDNALKESNGDNGINFGMYQRGLMRHYLDWLWGINLSRALMTSLKNSSGRFSTLSTGRVQGPTLAFVAKRQLEIRTHVPIPRFELDVQIQNGQTTELNYTDGPIDTKTKASKVVSTIQDGKAKVTGIVKKKISKRPPVPFNLSSLQKDAYRYYKIPPSRTLKAAETLYLAAVISYPRTSSEKFPTDLNHKKVISDLGKYQGLSKISSLILKSNKFRPIQGKKSDPAHPCIYPTGNLPKQTTADAKKVFSLIAHRYFATFGL
ncbi:MAG: hypothetical protein IH840_08330, partial [Candidatus Heimdallarchaeota archaeon]|nr:hypothetical protein [Candidatus Heimdallarchaeota archaeon]